MKKTQKIIFENDNKDRTACVLLIREPKMDCMPMYYRMVQQGGFIWCGKQKWDGWKQCTTPDQQMKYLHKHVWTYEPGKMPEHYDEIFQKIMLLVEAE